MMGGSWDLVIVGLLVAGAGVWAVRALVRSLKKPGGCSSCGSSGACPLVKGPDGGACPTEEPEPRRRGVALH
jgi:hypothetical protein